MCIIRSLNWRSKISRDFVDFDAITQHKISLTYKISFAQKSPSMRNDKLQIVQNHFTIFHTLRTDHNIYITKWY